MFPCLLYRRPMWGRLVMSGLPGDAPERRAPSLPGEHTWIWISGLLKSADPIKCSIHSRRSIAERALPTGGSTRHSERGSVCSSWRGVPFELRPCPYPGRRSEVQPDRPMNVSAMTRLVSTFPEALGALVIFREKYCRRFQIAQLLLFDLWRAKRRRLSTFQRTSLARWVKPATGAMSRFKLKLSLS